MTTPQFEVIGDVTTVVIKGHNYFLSNIDKCAREDVFHLRNQVKTFLDSLNSALDLDASVTAAQDGEDD